MSGSDEKGVTGGRKEGRVRGRLKLGWMDGAKVALGIRGMTSDAARHCSKDRKKWRAQMDIR